MDKEISVIEMGARNRAKYEASISYDLQLYDDLLEVEGGLGPNPWGEYRGPECILVTNQPLREKHHVGDMKAAGKGNMVINSSTSPEDGVK